MSAPFNYASLVAVFALLGLPFSSAQADSAPTKLSTQASATINPFAPRPASATSTNSAPTSTAPAAPLLPPPKFSASKLPPLPLPPPPEVPLPSFDGTGHAQGVPARRNTEEGATIGRARQAANCHLSMSRKEATAPAGGGTVILNFASRTPKDCAKAAMPDDEWIDVTNLGDRAVSLQIKENDTGGSRIGHVRIVSPDVGDAINVTINQKATESGVSQ